MVLNKVKIILRTIFSLNQPINFASPSLVFIKYPSKVIGRVPTLIILKIRLLFLILYVYLFIFM